MTLAEMRDKLVLSAGSSRIALATCTVHTVKSAPGLSAPCTAIHPGTKRTVLHKWNTPHKKRVLYIMSVSLEFMDWLRHASGPVGHDRSTWNMGVIPVPPAIIPKARTMFLECLKRPCTEAKHNATMPCLQKKTPEVPKSECTTTPK